ncbi:MAG: MBL fold metallo-hydrolase [Anaeroplasma bactoclasticum]|nr:MBL fold metallo-hydrolase [Anaeroplasma bactoclasticum]
MARRKKHNTIRKIIQLPIGILLLLLIGAALYFGYPYYKPYIDQCSHQKPVEEIVSGDLSIHFLEVGNQYTGDAVYIKAGETDVLIDAGSRKSSAETITTYLENYVVDNKLEYVIATHAHQDHIAGFVGTTKVKGIFEAFECETIIDFPKTNAKTALISEYYEKREIEIAEGANHYTALECYRNENGAKRSYTLSEGIELEILYNYYYENESSDENNYSVCVMIHQGSKHFLFTGDLEKEGEKYLIEYNDLPEVEVFKAGHHGSPTSTTDALLAVIKPKIVCVCCCAGSDEYTKNNLNQFPSQAFTSRICHYTDQIYVTTLATENGYTSYNGNIVITSNEEGTKVNCSHHNVIFKDTEWFEQYRKWE